MFECGQRKGGVKGLPREELRHPVCITHDIYVVVGHDVETDILCVSRQPLVVDAGALTSSDLQHSRSCHLSNQTLKSGEQRGRRTLGHTACCKVPDPIEVLVKGENE